MRTKARPAPPDPERKPKPAMRLHGIRIPEATYEAIAEEMRKRASYGFVLVCDVCPNDRNEKMVACDIAAPCNCCEQRRTRAAHVHGNPHHPAITRYDFERAYEKMTAKTIDLHPRAVGRKM